MSKAFRLGDYFKPEETAVPKLNTAQPERIEYLKLDCIEPDPDNFYSLEGIEDLAENIELVGLLDPIRVRPDGARYVVVSGHRRRAACMMIRDGGNPMFDKGVACIVERGSTDDDWRRLRLIFANSHTRVLSPAEISRQADEVLKLLTKLKASGVELPGRMREHVAEALNVSSSKLGRVQAIRRNLVPELLTMYDAGKINEAVAYRISQEDAEMQGKILADQGDVLQHLTADGIAAYVAHRRFMDSHRHDDGDVEAAISRPREQADDETDGPPRASAPTGEDGDGVSKALDSLDKLLAGRSKEDRQFWKLMQEAADHLILHSFANGAKLLRKDNIDMLRLDCRNASVAGFAADWQGSNKGLTLQHLRRGGGIERSWTDAYDALAAIAITRWRQVLVDERTKKPKNVPVPTLDTAPEFQTGTPPRDGRYFVRIDMGDGGTHEAVGSWRGGSWSVFNGPLYETMKVTGWYPLPEKGERKDA